MQDVQEANKSAALTDAPLGQKSQYISTYDASLLFPIPRQTKRDEINVPTPIPFHGFDTWNAFEVSWLNTKGKPVVAIASFEFACNSTNIIESKSFKLYLNSFNNSQFADFETVQKILSNDLQAAAEGDVQVKLMPLSKLTGMQIHQFSGLCLDTLDIECNEYTVNDSYLQCNSQEDVVSEIIHSDLLKSNCLVTGQPDWGSIQITYRGAQIDHEGLLKYLVSFRNHNEFHEQCVERIFMDITRRCQPKELTVEARYTRRGGLDINPVRSSKPIKPVENVRLARQ